MEFTIWHIILRLLIVFVAPNLLYMLLGFLLYWLGAKKVGHYFVSMSTVLFAFLSKWLASHCPYDSEDTCICFTCSHYEECDMSNYNHFKHNRKDKK